MTASLPTLERSQLLARAMEMRNAIDALESAMMGLGDFVDLQDLFENADPDLVLSPSFTVEQMRQVSTALNECTRIINSDDFLPRALAALLPHQGEAK